MYHIKLVFAILIAVCYSVSALPPNEIAQDKGKDESSEFAREKESCEAIPYKQDIIVDGCKPRTIDNNYCKGKCLSGYVPENGVNGKYKCSSCQPHQTVRKPLVLDCENGQKKIVEVEIFVSCQCTQTNCQVSRTNSKKFGEGGKKTTKGPIPTADPKRPCRYVCRQCRKARREYVELQNKKEKIRYLKDSCRLPECRKAISDEIFERAKIQKKLKKAVCKECQLCKKRKKEKHNA